MKATFSAILTAILLICGCKNEYSITGKWVIKEVANIKAGETLGEDFNQGSYFNFNVDHSFDAQNILGQYNGQWHKKNDTLEIIVNGKSDYLIVDYLSSDSLVLSKDGKAEILKFRLKKDK